MDLATGSVDYAISEVLRLPITDQRDDALYHLRRAREALANQDAQVLAILPFLILMLSQSSVVRRAASRRTSSSSQLEVLPEDRVDSPP